MPYVNVKLIGKLTHEQKAKICKGITDVLAQEAGKEPKYTYIVIEEIEPENWSMAGNLLG